MDNRFKGILMRHAECRKNLMNIMGGSLHGSLSLNGIRDSHRVSGELESLEKCSVTNIYCAPVDQCVETAEIFALKLGVRFVCHNSLRPLDMGLVSGFSQERLSSEYPELSRQLSRWRNGALDIMDLKIPGMEDCNKFYNRGVDFFLEQSKDENFPLLIATRSVLIMLSNVIKNRPPGSGYLNCNFDNLQYIMFR